MRLIDADALYINIVSSVCHYCDDENADCDECIAGKALKEIDNAPTVDAVPVRAIEQFKWERDTAIQQLEEHGIPFCGKADVVAVVRCKDCKKRGTVYCDLDYCGYRQSDNWFCADGERREEE